MRLAPHSPKLFAVALLLGACSSPTAGGPGVILPDGGADVPVVADAPALPTDTPVVADTPVANDTPVVTDTPVAIDTPVFIDTPIVTDVPIATDMPVVTDVPVVTDRGPNCPELSVLCSGLCVDVQTDARHCGACGNACAAGQSCAAGRCTTICAPGQTVCGATCRATQTDPDHCGACDMACPTPMNTTRFCAAGACGTSCRAGFGDCDSNAGTGCEASLDTVTNCGGCGRACSPANASASCVMGACRIGACNAGYADCNMAATDGCEANLNADAANCGACGRACGGAQVCLAGSCVERCPSGQTSCGGACTSTAFDPNHCGACGRACPIVPNTLRACASGVCVPGVCAPGFADCNRNAVDGCEVAVGTDPTNCGACGNVCNVANGTSVCRDGACGFGACNAGFASCDGNDANGCETNLQTASAHCGACGNACSGGQICRDSACVMAGGFSTDWVPQMGTNQQFTRCGSVSAVGSQVTCTLPEIRYGSTVGGIPYVHPGNEYTVWCQQLGFRAYVSHTTSSRDVTAPRGRLFGCRGYDESAWHWCDWSDGSWRNMSLDYHVIASDGIASITCSL
jgi:hypothetical protein